MSTRLTGLAFLVLLAAGLSAAANPMVGTWKMNMEKSTFSPGPAPKSSTIVISMDDDWIVSEANTVQADGQTVTRKNRYKLDGKEYPYDGPGGKGTIMGTRKDDHHTSATIKYDDGGMTKSTATISEDGNVRTLTTSGTNAKKEKVQNTIVYDKEP